MARKFLYLVAILIVLVIAVLVALRLYPLELTRIALEPDVPFEEQAALESNAYADPAMWYAHPELPQEDNPALWLPEMSEDRAALPTPAELDMRPDPAAAIFFVHPTSHWDKSEWNAGLDDPIARETTILFLKGMASPFAASGDVWAPRYRQATFGAFLSDKPEADQALDAAYGDVLLAFEAFIAQAGTERPLVLAGHSQGSVHLLRLLRERIKSSPEASRIAMIYTIGWPISLEQDLPELGYPACTDPDQSACIVSWASFAEPADPATLIERYMATAAFNGEKRERGPILCSNPLTGGVGGSAGMEANLGTLRPDPSLLKGTLVPGAVPAKCDESGILLIGDPPQLGQGVLPGNNYHVYDIPLFWENLRRDVQHRVNAWQAAR